MNPIVTSPSFTLEVGYGWKLTSPLHINNVSSITTLCLSYFLLSRMASFFGFSYVPIIPVTIELNIGATNPFTEKLFPF
jgi:hypothetical protein